MTGEELLLAQICILLLLVFGIFYFLKARKTPENMEIMKKLNIGFGILFLFLFISRVLDNPLAAMVDPARDFTLFGIPLANQDIYDIAKIFDYDYKLIVGLTPVPIETGFFTDMVFLLGLAVATFFMERAFIPKARHVFFIFLVITAFIAFITAFFPINVGTESDPILITINIFDTDRRAPAAYLFTAIGYISFAVIPIIYFVLAGKTTGDLRKNALLLAFGFILILVDVHTMGHVPQGNWVRIVPCLLGLLLVGIGNRTR